MNYGTEGFTNGKRLFREKMCRYICELAVRTEAEGDEPRFEPITRRSLVQIQLPLPN